MEKRGWIKVSRALPDHWIWQDEKRLKWWLDLLMMASWRNGVKVYHFGSLITLNRGEIGTSAPILAEKWRVSKDTVRRFLTMLETEGLIRREMRCKISVITICNFDNISGGESIEVALQKQRQKHTQMQPQKPEQVQPQKHTEVQGETQPETRHSIYKEEKEEVKKNIDGDDARTREEEFFRNFLKLRKRIENASTDAGTDVEDFKGVARAIFEEWREGGKIQHTDQADFTRHILATARIRIESRRKLQEGVDRKAAADRALMAGAAARMSAAIEREQLGGGADLDEMPLSVAGDPWAD